jgi:hypothetical protein
LTLGAPTTSSPKTSSGVPARVSGFAGDHTGLRQRGSPNNEFSR